MDHGNMRANAKRAVLWIALSCALAAGFTAHAQEPQGPETWIINGSDMPLAEFIAEVAAITGKTIVLEPRARQSQTVTVMSNVALDADGVYALFLTVLRVHGLGASETDGVVSVVQQVAIRQSGGPVSRDDEQPPDVLVTQVVALDHIQSTEVLKMLRPLIPQAGHMAAVDKPNVLIVADYASNLDRLLALIDQIDILDRDEIVHRVLEHAWVGTVATVLESIAPEELGRAAAGPRRVQIVANERNNSLVLKGKAHPIAEVLRLIDKLDVPETTTGAAQVFYLKHADASKVAEILGQLAQATGDQNTPAAIIQADESLNALIIRADPGTTNELLATVSQLDVRRLQVTIEAAIVEISVNAVRSLGIEAAVVDAAGRSVPLGSTTMTGIVGSLLARAAGIDGAGSATPNPLSLVTAAASPTLAVARSVPDGISFGAILQAIATDTRANLLSTPSVMTLDNEEAEMQAAEQIPFRTGSFTTTTDGASNPFQTISREPVGITLTVTPHVHDEGAIRMDVSLKAGNVVDRAIGGAAFADVVTNERNLDTTILVEDQQIVLLGGLIQDDYRDVGQKVPLLGDIPGIGRAFRSDRRTLVKRHLLMFLKAEIQRSGSDAELSARRRYQGIYQLRHREDIAVPPANLEGLFESRDAGG